MTDDKRMKSSIKLGDILAQPHAAHDTIIEALGYLADEIDALRQQAEEQR